MVRVTFRIVVLLKTCVVLSLVGCGGGGSDDDDDGGGDPLPIEIVGASVKGPLANATITAFDFNDSIANFIGFPIASGTTDDQANIIDLDVDTTTPTPFIVEASVSSDTRDLSLPANTPPALSILRSAITTDMFGSQDISITPLTTMAIEIAGRNADRADGQFQGNTNGNVSLAEFEAALPVAARQVISTFGFGLDINTDIFTAPALLTSETDNVNELLQVAAYRQAIEAVTAITEALQLDIAANTTVGQAPSIDQVLIAIATDIADGLVDGQLDGNLIDELVTASDLVATVLTDPNTLIIPGTTTAVSDIETVLLNETAATGVTVVDPTPLQAGGGANVDLQPVDPAPDDDGDGVLDINDTFPNDPNENADSDGDGIGDEGDNCPNDANPNQTDGDDDGVGDACDNNQSNDAIWNASNWDEVNWQ